eukprot:6989024-Karenia_brevis.AAC.1
MAASGAVKRKLPPLASQSSRHSAKYRRLRRKTSLDELKCPVPSAKFELVKPSTAQPKTNQFKRAARHGQDDPGDQRLCGNCGVRGHRAEG